MKEIKYRHTTGKDIDMHFQNFQPKNTSWLTFFLCFFFGLTFRDWKKERKKKCTHTPSHPYLCDAHTHIFLSFLPLFFFSLFTLFYVHNELEQLTKLSKNGGGLVLGDAVSVFLWEQQYFKVVIIFVGKQEDRLPSLEWEGDFVGQASCWCRGCSFFPGDRGKSWAVRAHKWLRTGRTEAAEVWRASKQSESD